MPLERGAILCAMCKFRDHGNHFQKAAGHYGAGAAILLNLVERRVREYRKGDGRRN
jgi:hypothetical protein